MINELKPCPFCGGEPEFPSGDGTQYELECDCGMAKSCVQISDLMDAEERANDDFIDYRYNEEFVTRAKTECINRWNERHLIDHEQELRDNLERHNEKVREKTK